MTVLRLKIAGEDCPDSSTGLIEANNIIDGEHLARMTLGDRQLEREVLQIFVRQTAMMLGRIGGGDAVLAATAAHALKGSARGIGAWRVAQAAESLERASDEGSDEKLAEAVAELRAATLEASAAIGARLSEPPR